MSRANKSIASSGAKLSRRHMLKLGGALAGTLAIPELARAAGPKIRVGYLPLSAGLPLPKQVFAHGFVYNKGAKISKSAGTAIDPMDVLG